MNKTVIDRELRELILRLAPDDGNSIGNKALLEALTQAAGLEVAERDYFRVRDVFVQASASARGCS